MIDPGLAESGGLQDLDIEQKHGNHDDGLTDAYGHASLVQQRNSQGLIVQ